MTTVPRSWGIDRLDAVADVRLGRQRSPRHHSGPNMRPYLRAANVDWDGLKLEDVKSMNFTDEEMQVYRLEPGDLVLGEASGSPGEVGKPALWSGQIADCAFQNTLVRVRSRGPEPRFLLHWFRHLAISGAFASESRGVGIHHIGKAKLAAWPTPIPPLDEQRRIVEILEDHLSRLDVAGDTLRSVIKHLAVLNKSILVELVPASPPPHWSLTNVGEAGMVDLGRQRHPDWHHGPEMRPYLRVANVFEDRIDTSDVMEMDFSPGMFERFRLSPGDVLLNEGQSPELLGRPAIYRGEPPDVAFTNSLLRFRVRDGVLPEWALLVFRRHMHSGRFALESRITTNIAHLSAGRLKAVEFPIPPLEEQRSLVKAADGLFGDVARLRHGVQVGLVREASLRRALLQAAFSGRLTGQASGRDLIEELASV